MSSPEREELAAERQAALENAIDRQGKSARETRRRVDRGLCMNCGKRPGRIAWGDTLAFTHGWAEKRCRRCVYGPQLLHALGRVVALPRLVILFLYSLVTNS